MLSPTILLLPHSLTTPYRCGERRVDVGRGGEAVRGTKDEQWERLTGCTPREHDRLLDAKALGGEAAHELGVVEGQ